MLIILLLANYLADDPLKDEPLKDAVRKQPIIEDFGPDLNKCTLTNKM